MVNFILADYAVCDWDEAKKTVRIKKRMSAGDELEVEVRMERE